MREDVLLQPAPSDYAVARFQPSVTSHLHRRSRLATIWRVSALSAPTTSTVASPRGVQVTPCCGASKCRQFCPFLQGANEHSTAVRCDPGWGRWRANVIDPVLVWSAVASGEFSVPDCGNLMHRRWSLNRPVALPFSCFSEPFASSCAGAGNHCWTGSRRHKWGQLLHCRQRRRLTVLYQRLPLRMTYQYDR